jgi:hypothetical protein
LSLPLQLLLNIIIPRDCRPLAPHWSKQASPRNTHDNFVRSRGLKFSSGSDLLRIRHRPTTRRPAARGPAACRATARRVPTGRRAGRFQRSARRCGRCWRRSRLTQSGRDGRVAPLRFISASLAETDTGPFWNRRRVRIDVHPAIAPACKVAVRRSRGFLAANRQSTGAQAAQRKQCSRLHDMSLGKCVDVLNV